MRSGVGEVGKERFGLVSSFELGNEFGGEDLSVGRRMVVRLDFEERGVRRDDSLLSSRKPKEAPRPGEVSRSRSKEQA